MASCGGGNSRSALRKWQPTPVFLTEEFHGQRSYVVTKSWIQLSNDECPLCISFFLQGLANICLSNLCFSISIWIVSFPFWSPKPPFPIFFFEFSWRWYLRWGFWPFGQVSFLFLLSFLECLPPTQVNKFYLIFLWIFPALRGPGSGR